MAGKAGGHKRRGDGGDCTATKADHVCLVHRKPHLPTKTCVVCGRPYAWRRKWERVWDEVLYCSDACRRAAAKQRRATSPTPNRAG